MTTLNKFNDDAVSANYDIITTFFQITIDLEQRGSRIPDAWSMILQFSSIATFCITKSEERSKKSLTQVSCYGFE